MLEALILLKKDCASEKWKYLLSSTIEALGRLFRLIKLFHHQRLWNARQISKLCLPAKFGKLF